jgi:hypothetical protein
MRLAVGYTGVANDAADGLFSRPMDDLSPSKKQKNKPAWRARLDGRGALPGCDAKFPGYQSRFGDGHPNRTQCVAIARGTGVRCRNDAIQGASCCRVHGGHRHGRIAAEKLHGRDRVIVTKSGKSARRKSLATLGVTERIPEGLPIPLSPVERGRVLEAYANRITDPKTWIEITTKHRLSPKSAAPPKK